ncbi:hypothetical protein As57867_006585, partial [Aphanomyces stellatus]
STLVSAFIAAITEDARLLLVKDSILTVLFGATFLGSIFFAREDLIWYYNRQMQGPEAKTSLDAMYAIPAVRSVTHFTCVVWGVGLLVEAGIRMVLIYTIDINALGYVSPALMVVTMTSLALWNVLYVRHVKRQYQA